MIFLFDDSLDVPPKKKGRRQHFNPRPPVPHTGWKRPTGFPDLSGANAVCWDFESKDLELKDAGPGWGRGAGHPVGIAVATDDGYKAYYPVAHEDTPEDNFPVDEVKMWMGEQLAHHGQWDVFWNGLYDWGWFLEWGLKVHPSRRVWDGWIAEKLIRHQNTANLEDSGQRRIGKGKKSTVMLQWIHKYFGRGPMPNDEDDLDNALKSFIYATPPSLAGPYAEEDTVLPLEMASIQEKLMEERGLMEVFNMECQLIPLLAAMRHRGVRVDMPAAEKADREITMALEELHREIRHIAGRTVEVNSGEDVGRLLLASGIQVPLTPKTKKPSIKDDFLEALDLPVAEKIAEARELIKFQSTFVRGAVMNKSVKSRVHSSFNPLKAITGRFSCVAGFTPILTQRGEVPIAEVKVGDRVWTHKGRWKPVTATWIKGKEAMVTLCFSDRQLMTCTREHRVLTLAGDWITVAQLLTSHRHVRLHSCNQESRDHPSNFGTLPETRSLPHKADWSDAASQLSQHSLHSTATYVERGIQSLKTNSLLSLENGGQKSNERTFRGCPPQLERGLQRQQEASHSDTSGKTEVRASYYNGTGVGYPNRKLTEKFGCPPHRWRPLQQLIGQSSSLHKERAPNDPRQTASRDRRGVTLKEVHVEGCFDVYDITVADDASYLACGVFSHNSSTPNLQNLPSRNPKLAPIIRSIFTPDEGHHHYRKYDYASIESRMLAHFAVGKNSEALREEYCNNPKTDYHNFTTEMVKRETGLSLPRKSIKNVNFAICYGAGDNKLARMLKLPKAEVEPFFNSYHTGLPYVRSTLDHYSALTGKTGFTQTIMGRRVEFDEWEPAFWQEGVERRSYSYDEAIQRFGARICRANLYCAVNYIFQGSAADIIKSAMLKCLKDGVFDYTGNPLLQVHDELTYSAPDDSADTQEAFAEMKRIMETVLTFKVPIRVSAEKGSTWGTCEEF